MAERIIKLPDVGEGIAEAELVEWHVKIGDIIREDDLIAAVMTDKATVEIPAPVDGKVTWIGAEIGDTVAIGSALVRLEVAGEGGSAEIANPDDDLTVIPGQAEGLSPEPRTDGPERKGAGDGQQTSDPSSVLGSGPSLTRSPGMTTARRTLPLRP